MQLVTKKYLTLALVLLTTAIAAIAGYKYLENSRAAFLQSYQEKQNAKETP